jgi:murein DD-endopeptidase MepM/ murein hydrolase activator NlpD
MADKVVKVGCGKRFRGWRPGARKTAGVLLVIIAAAGILFLGRSLFKPRPTERTAAEQTMEPAPAPETAPALEEKKLIIPSGASLALILEREGFARQEIHRIKESVKPVYDLGRIRAGREMRLYSLPGAGWKRLEYDIDEASYLTVDNDAVGVRAAVAKYPYEVRTAFVRGTVEDSLIAAVNSTGERDALALELVERCFGWDIDFYSDVRRGDSFRIVFEKVFINGRFSGYRSILAAEYVNAGTVHRAFRFTYPDTGVVDYFDESGNSKRKEFLRSPFKFTPRITSRFSSSRLHPIYRVFRPHYGVDYAAPVGTQVQATADGRVEFAGWRSGSGRMVRLQHKNQYETMYLHLSGFGPKVKKGSWLSAGEVVGYVGSSGDSTGPHLDYRVYYHGRPVNPLSQKFKPADPLRREFLEPFKAEVRRLSFALDVQAFFSRPLPAAVR